MKKEMIVILGLLLVVAPLVSAQPQGVTPELDKKFNNASPSEKVEAIVVMQDRPSQAQISTIKSDGASVDKEFEIVNAVSVSVPEQAAQAIANRPFVDRIEPDYSVELFLDQSAGQINADDVWNENTTGKDVDVSIVDTGIDNDHSQLEQEAQKDFTGEGTDDLNGHGTHVAGIVASTDNNYRGVSYNADLFDAKALNEEGSGTASDVIDAIEWSVNNGAEVISLSLGAKVDSCDGNDILSEAVDNAVSEGSVAVVAAGNYGPDSETITIPGCSRKAITVGAVDDSNNMADFSSRGPTADGRTKPDVVAPGVSISSTWNDGSYNSISGTSMATPHVSGLAALMLSENQDLSTSEVKNEITSNAEDLGYESNSQGSGLVDALASYNSVKVNETKNETKNETSNETEEDNETSGETNKTLPPGLERMSELPPGLKKKAGSLPGSAGHRFERFFENINLAFTFDSKKKVEKETEFASERVAESSVLFYKNKTEKATETLKEARENLRDARKTAKGLEIVGENSSELREKIKNTTNRSTQVLKEVYERVPEQAKESIRNAINQSTKNESSTKGSKNNTPRGKGFFGNDSESPGKDGQKGPDNERDSDKSVANPGPEDNPGLEGEANAGASANAGSQGASANAGAEASVSVSAPTSASQGQGSSNSDSDSNSGNSGSGGNSGNGNSGSPGNSGTSGGNGGGPGNAPVTGNTIFKDFFTA